MPNIRISRKNFNSLLESKIKRIMEAGKKRNLPVTIDPQAKQNLAQILKNGTNGQGANVGMMIGFGGFVSEEELAKFDSMGDFVKYVFNNAMGQGKNLSNDPYGKEIVDDVTGVKITTIQVKK